jgi:hypothetical protein
VIITVSAAAALVPTFGAPTATADGFTVQITNYDAAYTWAGTATTGSVAIDSSTGVVTVTGVAPGTSSTVTVSTTRTGYTNGSASVSATSSPAAVICTTTSGGSTPIACAVSTTSVRVYGPGGGQVFYDAGSVQSWGRYMEAATADSSSGIVWCSNTSSVIAGVETIIVASESVIGSGKTNTDLMVAGGACTSGAANSALAYGTATAPAGSWFLPNLAELNQLYVQKDVVGGFAAFYYWSSSLFSADRAWHQFFDRGSQDVASKNNPLRVRPVRAF